MPGHIAFGPFHLESEPLRLRQGSQVIDLRPRTLAMLHYLAEHPNRLVTKEELRRHIWQSVHLTDTVLRVCVQEIRAALADSSNGPRYLETIRGWGYRFLDGREASVDDAASTRLVVGRHQEAQQLAEAESCFRQALEVARAQQAKALLVELG